MVWKRHVRKSGALVAPAEAAARTWSDHMYCALRTGAHDAKNPGTAPIVEGLWHFGALWSDHVSGLEAACRKGQARSSSHAFSSAQRCSIVVVRAGWRGSYGM